ncbi:Ceramide kinase [Armadillidium vulgare]|nr:Ceramide kinase [Armadillidium vulgare]
MVTWGETVYIEDQEQAFFKAEDSCEEKLLAAVGILIVGLKERPNKLVVVINPVGGRKRACKDFYKKVYPIFKRAWIHTKVIQTKYKGHGTHIIKEAASSGELKDCDGIVAVGGDGLVSEIVTGLFVVAADSQGLSHDDAEVDFPATQIRLGIIPCGSTDATCFATHGSSDIVTAALHIVMESYCIPTGDKRFVDVASIHADGKLHRVVTTLISYGYFGDLMRSSEHLRCLGPPRYILSGVQQVLRNRSYPVDISFRKRKHFPDTETGSTETDSTLQSTLSCSSICTVCSQLDEDVDYGISTEDDWQSVHGLYSIVSAAITSCSCRLTPQGVSPLAHLGDGYCDLILVKGSSRVKLLSYLYHTSVTGNAASLNHVRMIRTNEIKFSAPPDRLSSFNCDGEELEKASLRIKIHRKKLELFCRGVEKKLLPSSPNVGRKFGRDSINLIGNGENGMISC